MDTAAALRRVHMCRYLMLCVCGTMLAVHITTGVPVLRKATATPRWPAKPAPHTYVPKRFLRLWSEKQKDLLMEGPSGDGPLDSWDSTVLPRKTSEAHSTLDDYATRSPLPEEIFPSQSIPFPTVIDTAIETPETFSDELISRSSVPFHGPSSLLNTLIFRPTLPDESATLISPTPTSESSSTIAQTSLYDLSASWTEAGELVSSFQLSSRRALSYSPSEVFAIITAISATYIYQEDSMTSSIDPSIIDTRFTIGSMFQNVTTYQAERVPGIGNATPTFIASKSVHLQSSYESYFDISSTIPTLFEGRYSVSNVQTSFSTNLFPFGISDALTGDGLKIMSSSSSNELIIEYSTSLSDSFDQLSNSKILSLDTISGHPVPSTSSSFLLWNPYSTSIVVDASSLSSEIYHFNNNSLDSSFVESYLSHKSSDNNPLLSPLHTLFLSNVETTVTIIDNKDTPFTYILPTLTVTGTSFNGSLESFSSFLEEFTLLPSRSGIEMTIFNDFSSFKHLYSSFDTKSISFDTTSQHQDIASASSHRSLENFVSATSVSGTQTDLLQSKEVTISPTTTHSYFTTFMSFPDKTNQSMASSRLSVSHEYSEMDVKLPSESILIKTEYLGNTSETQSIEFGKYQTKVEVSDRYSGNQIESDSHTEMQGAYNVSEYLSPSPTLPNIIQSLVPENNETRTHFNEIYPPITASFETDGQIDTSVSWKSTDSLDKETTNESYKPSSMYSSFILLPENFTRIVGFNSSVFKNGNLKTSNDSIPNFLDPFTHHITVRSLRGSSSFDVLTEEFMDRITTGSFGGMSGTYLITDELTPSFVTTVPTKYFSSLLTPLETTILPIRTETSLNDVSSLISKGEISFYTSIFSETLIHDGLATSPDLAKDTETHLPEPSFTPFKSSYSEEFSVNLESTPNLSNKYISSTDQDTILHSNKSKFDENYVVQSPVSSTIQSESNFFSQSVKSVSEFENTMTLDSSPSGYFEVTESFYLSDVIPDSSFEETFNVGQSANAESVSVYNQVTPTFPVLKSKEHTDVLSELDNHFLERSSNISSKALGYKSSLKSIMIRGSSMEIDMDTESQATISLGAGNFDSVLSTYTSNMYVTSSLPMSNYDFETVSLKENSTFDDKEPKRSYFEFHESTRVLDYETKILTSSTIEFSEYVRSFVYDSFDRYSDSSNDFEVSSTPALRFSQMPILSSLTDSISWSNPEESHLLISSTENVAFHSFLLPDHPEIKSKVEESVAKVSKQISSTSQSSSVYPSLHQKLISEDVISKSKTVPPVSFFIESSLYEMGALDVSTLFRELTLPVETSSPKCPSNSFSTMAKEARSMDLFLPESNHENAFSMQLISTRQPESPSLFPPSIKKFESVKSDELNWLFSSSFMTSVLPISLSLSSVKPRSIKTLSTESDYHQLGSTTFLVTPTLFSYSSSVTSTYVNLIPSSVKEPVSIESGRPIPIMPSLLQTPILVTDMTSKQWQSKFLTSSTAKEPLSIESDRPKPIMPSSLRTPILPSYTTSEQFQSKFLTFSTAKEPVSLESDRPKPIMPDSLRTPILPSYTTSERWQSKLSTSSTAKEPLSIESDNPKPTTPYSIPTTIIPSYVTSEHWQSKISSVVKEPSSIESGQSTLLFRRTFSTSYLPRTDVLLSNRPQYETPVLQPKEDPKSIDSSHPQHRASSYISKPVATFYNTPILSGLEPTTTHSKTKEPQSIESDLPKPKVSSSLYSTRLPLQTSFLSMKPHLEELQSNTYNLQNNLSIVKPTSMKMDSSSAVKTTFGPTWLGDSKATPDGTDGIILVSVLPVSSFLNINQTKNATIDSGRKDESQSSSGEQTVPTRDPFLFKDNHYWVLTVLEAPIKGQLPDNFSHTMEIRLANAYSEAFRSWPSKTDDVKGAQEMIVVKVLSLTDDILLKQLKIVYVVERAGALVPSSIAAEYLNSLRFEQLREFLGHHAIIKAESYRPPNDDISRPVGSPLPVLAIVGGVLLGLLVLFCCFCIYCRCCRPKPEPSSPSSSTSGSLQRSLSKYGQHNRKHLFREMTHQLTSEMAAQIKHGSTAPDTYLADKSTLSRRSLPALPREQDDSERKLDPSMKMLKILENKDASTSPRPAKTSRGTNGAMKSDDTSSTEKKKPPKPKKRRKVKDSVDQASKNAVSDPTKSTREPQPESPPPTPPPKMDVSIPSAENRQSPDSGTSSRHPSSQPSSPSEKGTEEAESEGSNVELLPPIQDLIDRSKSESEAAAAETQMHLSRVRQRISDLLDDAFALAGGRRLYGSLRSKKIEPAANIYPRFGSFRSQSVAGGEFALTKHQGSISMEQRPISEGGQRLLGVITDEGQLITHPPPKLVWEQDEGYSLQAIERPIGNEMVEARNRNINLFPFHQQRVRQIPALPSASSLPLLDTLPESHHDTAMASTISILREAASELYLPHSARMNPATVDHYDELDVVSALRNGEPVEALIQAIKDELQRFAGTLPGTNDSESNA